MPMDARRRASATKVSTGRLRCFPRMPGMMQKVQTRLQPSASLRKAVAPRVVTMRSSPMPSYRCEAPCWM